jgi:hypothetical protein
MPRLMDYNVTTCPFRMFKASAAFSGHSFESLSKYQLCYVIFLSYTNLSNESVQCRHTSDEFEILVVLLQEN